MKEGTIELQWFLGIVLVMISIVPFIFGSIISYRSIEQSMTDSLENNLKIQTKIISDEIDVIYANADDILYLNMQIVREKTRDRFSIIFENQTHNAKNIITKEYQNISLVTLRYDNQSIAGNQDLFDSLSIDGSLVKILQITKKGYLDLQNSEIYPYYHPIIDSLENKNYYSGRQNFRGTWYIVRAEPLVLNKEIIGSIIVAVPEKSFLDEITNDLKRVTIGETGYVRILDDQGNVVLSENSLEEGNVWNKKDQKGNYYFQSAITSGFFNDETGIIYYDEFDDCNGDMVAAYHGKQDIGWLIMPSVCEAEFTQGLRDYKRLIFFISLLAILISIILAIIISRLISKNIQKIVQGIGKVASGDLTQDIKDKSFFAEIKKLSTMISTMIATLHSTVSNIAKASNEIDAMSGVVSQNTDDLNIAVKSFQKTTEHLTTQNHKLRTIVSNSLSVTKVMDLNSDDVNQKAKDTAKISEELSAVAKKIESSTIVAGKEMTAMKEIVIKTSKSVENFKDKSSEITNIVDLINSIAEQTSLLSLNAAIEAARAGESGKGFAVVAEEIKKLADQSQSATARIEEMISGLHEDTELIVNSMNAGVDRVDQGSEVVSSVLKDLHIVFDSINKVDARIHNISESAESLKSSSVDIGISMAQINDISMSSLDLATEVSSIAQETSSNIDLIAGISKKLLDIAEELKRLSDRFKV